MNVGAALREFLLEGFLVARELGGGCASGAALRGCGAVVALVAVPVPAVVTALAPAVLGIAVVPASDIAAAAVIS